MPLGELYKDGRFSRGSQHGSLSPSQSGRSPSALPFLPPHPRAQGFLPPGVLPLENKRLEVELSSGTLCLRLVSLQRNFHTLEVR